MATLRAAMMDRRAGTGVSWMTYQAQRKRQAPAVPRAVRNLPGRAVQRPFIIERLSPTPGAAVVCDGTSMSTSRDDFDPIAAVVGWLDACRRGDLNALLNFYDEPPPN
jgi:hypothetical protein